VVLGGHKRPAWLREVVGRPAAVFLMAAGPLRAHVPACVQGTWTCSGNVLIYSRQPRQLELQTWPPPAGPSRPAAQSRPASDRCRRAPVRATSATTRPTSRPTCSAWTARPGRAAGGPGSA
jgi:hypothetical protein